MENNNIGNGILSTIGSTPLISLNNLYPTEKISIYGKLEAFNPGGSIKDRTAYNILTKAIESGKLSKGSTVVESSSGNMAVGLAQVCLKYGLNLVVVVDPLINQQTLKILEAYGATIDMVNPASDNFLEARLQRVQHLLNTIEHSFWPNQYANPANPSAHHQTMAEIIADLGAAPDYLFVATSTCGTIMGCAEYLQRYQAHTQIIAVDAEGSLIFADQAAKRLIPGHGAGRKSQLLNMDYVDTVVHVNDEECVKGCHRLLKREAILAGGSSGAAVVAIDKMLPNIPKNSTCVIIICDRGERYLNTIYSKDWVSSHFGNIDLDFHNELVYAES